jgi:GT2 family glycosyltransferase
MCLEALGAQKDARGAPLAFGTFGVVLFLNNCRDGSANLAQLFARTFPQPMRIVERELAPASAHAGGARRIAMDFAASWLDESDRDGLLLTTDADSRVGPSWIVANLEAAAAGADAVAGRITLDRDDSERLPEQLHRRGRLEAIYAMQLIEIAALLDPQSHNPWPHHATASGASLAVTLSAYRRIGGLPALSLGEDKALVAALQAQDARVRFAPEIEVTTSGRLEGRAVGGTADTIRLRSRNADALCDEALEPVSIAVRRARWRGFLRRLHAQGRLTDSEVWVSLFGSSRAQAIRPSGRDKFGEVWSHIERVSPLLRRRRLSPSALPPQISRAGAMLGWLRRRSESGEKIQAEGLGPLAVDERGEGGSLAEKQFGGFVAR